MAMKKTQSRRQHKDNSCGFCGSLRYPLMLCLFAGCLFILILPISAGASNNDSPDQSQPNDVNEPAKEIPRPSHDHPSFEERTEERLRMVETQITDRGVEDPNTIAAMKTVPRHMFVRQQDRFRAYSDQPMPIGYGQTISQPYIVAYMTEKLELDPNDVVLEIGAGSGYHAAVAAETARAVYTIEIVSELAESAEETLRELGYKNVFVKDGDGYYGWPEFGPYDAIVVTAAAGFVPPPLLEQLKPDGKLVMPLGSPYGMQTLVVVTRDEENRVRSRRLMPVRFVPMTGRALERQ